MNSNYQFSVNEKTLEKVQFDVLGKTKETRYCSSHTVWQLAQMGAYNTSASLPAAIRIDPFGSIIELYHNQERCVATMDSPDSESEEPRLLFDILFGFIIRQAISTDSAKIRFHIVTSLKFYESASEKLVDWKNAAEIRQNLTNRIMLFKVESDIIKLETDVEKLVTEVLGKTSLEYQRRRQGRLGDESLWGRELDAVKVLQDTGIAGVDLAHALKSLIRAVSGNGDSDVCRTGQVLDRKAAWLLIRDAQRRARLTISGIRLIDERFISEEQGRSGFLPRSPLWNQIVKDPQNQYIQRESFEMAVKWARRAIMTCGRGLLPLFLFSGPSGSGKSSLLKQTAWVLYQQGFTVAEILDVNLAASEAERLATAAVALDTPLVLIWDDPVGMGADPLPAIREIAFAQISGVPILILGTLPDKGNSTKQYRRISRTFFEEFTVHPLTPSELTQMGVSYSEELPVRTSEITPVEPSDSPTSDAVSSSLEHDETDSVDSDTIIKPDMSDPKILMHISTPVTGFSLIHAAAESVAKMKFAELIETIAAEIQSCEPETRRIMSIITLLDSIGLSTPMSLIEKISDPATIPLLSTLKIKTGDPIFRSMIFKLADAPERLDVGHPALAESLASTPALDETAAGELFEKVLTVCIHDSKLQPFAGSIIRALNHSKFIPSAIRDRVSLVLTEAIEKHPATISPILLRDLFNLIDENQNERLYQAIIDGLIHWTRSFNTDSFISLVPLIRNRLGGMDDQEVLKTLNAAKPSFDRVGFKFLLKFLGDHLPGDSGKLGVENARTAAARDPDEGFAVAAYLRLVWQRGSEEQIERASQETRSWLSAQPDDRVVRRTFYEYVLKKGTDEDKKQAIEQLSVWLESHFDEGPLRRTYLDIAASLEDHSILDKVLDETAEWIQKLGNNRATRIQFFRLSEQRQDKEIMLRACKVAIAWLDTHSDDRDAIRSTIFLSNRVNKDECRDKALVLIGRFFSSHLIDRDLFKLYLSMTDKTSNDKLIQQAVELADAYLDEHPADVEIREAILGLSGKKMHSKIQLRIYDKNSNWLAGQTTPNPMLEYLTGRLGVRAGVARRAIPLLERASAREDASFRNHARLWLGSAYRIAGDFKLARSEWIKAQESEDESMREKAQRNLESLEKFLAEKFPGGWPPQEEQKSRPRRIREDRQQKDAPAEGRDQRPPRSMPPRTPQPAPAATPVEAAVPQPVRPPLPIVHWTPPPKDGGVQKLREDRRPKGKSDFKPEAPRPGVTLGDLFKLKGLDLKTELSKPEKNKKK